MVQKQKSIGSAETAGRNLVSDRLGISSQGKVPSCVDTQIAATCELGSFGIGESVTTKGKKLK